MTTENSLQNFGGDASTIPEGYRGVRRVLGLFHGILTGRTDETWPENWEDLILLLDARSRCILSWYYGLPFPRLEALRNRKRFPALVRRLKSKVEFAAARGLWASIFLVGHSNGGALVLMVARKLIEAGYTLDGILLMAPAVRSKATSEEIAGWIADGKLKKATLLMATRDKTLNFVSRVRFATWPWGALGVEGWCLDGIAPEVSAKMRTIRLAEGHSQFLSPAERERTFREIAAPFFGLSPEGAQPEGAAA